MAESLTDEDRVAEFKNFHRALCERFGYGHDERDWRRDQVSLIEHIAKRMEGPMPTLEDWAGADLEHTGCFEVRRAYNGVVVLPSSFLSRDTVTDSSRVLVFQNPEHFWSWFTQWLEKTKRERS